MFHHKHKYLFVVVEAVNNWSLSWRELGKDIQELKDYVLMVVDDGKVEGTVQRGRERNVRLEKAERGLVCLRVSFLVLHGGEAPLSGQQVADISSGGPGKKSTKHPLAHLER